MTFGFTGSSGSTATSSSSPAREHQRHRTLLALRRLFTNSACAALDPDIQPGHSRKDNNPEKKCRHLICVRICSEQIT